MQPPWTSSSVAYYKNNRKPGYFAQQSSVLDNDRLALPGSLTGGFKISTKSQFLQVFERNVENL